MPVILFRIAKKGFARVFRDSVDAVQFLTEEIMGENCLNMLVLCFTCQFTNNSVLFDINIRNKGASSVSKMSYEIVNGVRI